MRTPLVTTLILAAVICGTAVILRVCKAKTNQRKLAEIASLRHTRAAHGDAKAQYEMGSMSFHGKGAPQDYTEAVGWYRKAADQDYAEAQSGLGYMYYEGKGVPQDYVEAVGWYRKAAERGDAMAQDSLGYMYYEGKGAPQDYAEAVSWYRKAADQGYAKAQYDLGYIYYEGKGAPQDYAKAVGWYRKAAERGDAMAQDSLGYMYSQGKGVLRDYGEAVSWYRKGADQGYARAQYHLGYVYSEGKGAPQDYAEAALWYRKAAKHGDEYAQRALGSTRMGLSTFSKITLSVAFLGGIFFLISSRASIRDRQHRATTLAGLLLLSRVGLDLYVFSHFDILQSVSAVNAFYFTRHFVSGIWIAALISLVWPRGTKAVLGISGVQLIVFIIYAVAHYDLRRLTPLIRFYSGTGLLLGMSIPSAIFLWLTHKNSTHKGSQAGYPGPSGA